MTEPDLTRLPTMLSYAIARELLGLDEVVVIAVLIDGDALQMSERDKGLAFMAYLAGHPTWQGLTPEQQAASLAEARGILLAELQEMTP